jgi:hypothetical protein
MSTRANIIVKERHGQILLYHHCDGYPEGVGVELKTFLGRYKWWSAETIARGLVTMKDEWNSYPYQPSICKHGDVEYVYVIDCEKKTLTCYSSGFGESFEDCCIPERICVIP